MPRKQFRWIRNHHDFLWDANDFPPRRNNLSNSLRSFYLCQIFHVVGVRFTRLLFLSPWLLGHGLFPARRWAKGPIKRTEEPAGHAYPTCYVREGENAGLSFPIWSCKPALCFMWGPRDDSGLRRIFLQQKQQARHSCRVLLGAKCPGWNQTPDK